MEKKYKITGNGVTRKIARFLAENGNSLLPLVGLIGFFHLAVEDPDPLLGRARIEGELQLSAPGRASRQAGCRGALAWSPGRNRVPGGS